MPELNEIKSEKLRNAVAGSLKFRLLPQDERDKLLSRIVNLPEQIQEKFYLPFFTDENLKETPLLKKRSETFKLLLEKMEEASRRIKSIASKETETVIKSGETQTEEQLLSQLKNL